MRADDFHNGTMYAAFMLPCCLGRGSDRSSQFGMEEFATATGGWSLVASVCPPVSLCVIMWKWRDVEKNPIKPASDDGSARGRTKIPVRGSVRGGGE